MTMDTIDLLVALYFRSVGLRVVEDSPDWRSQPFPGPQGAHGILEGLRSEICYLDVLSAATGVENDVIISCVLYQLGIHSISSIYIAG